MDRCSPYLCIGRSPQGQLANWICSTLLAQQYGHRRGTLTSVCDNQGVLRREERAAYDIQLGSHKEAEADLLLTMREWARRSPYRVHLRWVKGHQDEDTPVEKLSLLAKLNVEMDELAESVHNSTFPFKTTMDQEVLPAERWALFLDSEKVTTKLRDRVLHRCHSVDLVSYVAKRHSLSEHDIEHIAWSALHAYLRRQKMARRAVVVKYLHDWLPTKGFLHKNRDGRSRAAVQCVKTGLRRKFIYFSVRIRKQ